VAINHQALADEYRLDPRGYGYATDLAIGNDNGLMARGNEIRTGANPPANPTAAGGSANGSITIRRANVAPAEILEAIDIRDLQPDTNANSTRLSAAWFQSVSQLPFIRLANPDSSKTVVRKNIDRLVNDTQLSQTRLDAVAIRNGSRNEELFGQNVGLDDVSSARSLLAT
jgi:hypothetical protein